MSNFIYKAIDNQGKITSGRLNSLSESAAADKLNYLGYRVISLIQEKTPLSSIDNFLAGFSRVKIEDLVMYNVQLSSMIAAGLSLPNSLHILIEQLENKKLKGVTQDIYQNIKSGSSFSEALRKHPDVFSSLFTNMVKSGEVAGNLEDVLKRLAVFAEKEAELKQKVMTALFYPIILTVLGVGVVTFIVLTVLPAFVKIFMDAGVPLPLPTAILYYTNVMIRTYWLYILIVMGGSFAAFGWFKKTAKGKETIDKIVFAAPVLGNLIRKITIARFARTLSALLSSGVSMLEALETTEKTLDNTVMSKIVRKVYNSVSKGENLTKPLQASKEFPPMAVQMIAVGEETGNIDNMLNKVADFYELSTDYSIKRMTALIEPIFLIIIAGMVGTIFASILLPIFRMVGTIRR